MTRHLILAALALGAVATTASSQRASSTAGFPIRATANTASAVKAAVQASVRRYTSPRARVTGIRRAGRYWHVTTTAPAPYGVLLCTTRYCSGTPGAQAPTIRVEVTR